MSDPLFPQMEPQTIPTSGQQPETRDRQGLKLARILVLIGALGIVAIGLLVGGTAFLMALLDRSGNALPIATAGVSFLALSVGLGLGLAWQAGQAIAGRPSRPFQPRRIWIGLLLFVAALILGQSILSLKLATLFTFPLFHVAAAALPPLIIVALIGRATGGTSRWRDVILETGSGAFFSTFLAFTLEFVAILGAVAAGVAIVAMRPGGVETLHSLAQRLQDPTLLQNPANLSSLIASPLILVAILFFFAAVVPLIEESVKTLGVGLLAYRHPSLPEAVVWGLASGAGFAMVEALLNSVSGLDGWLGVVLLRVGASMLHCLTGGLMGLGWYYLLAERRWGRTIGLYAAAISLHGLWNGLAIGMALISLSAVEQGATAAAQGLAGLGSLAILILLVLLCLGLVVGLALLARYVRRHGAAGQPASAQTADPGSYGVAGEQA